MLSGKNLSIEYIFLIVILIINMLIANHKFPRQATIQLNLNNFN